MNEMMGTITNGMLPCRLSREEIIARIGLLADIHIRGLLSSLTLQEFTEIAEYPVEIMTCTANGYQRFLSETTPTIIQKTAGFILRYKSALIYELGKEVLNVLEKEHITLNASDVAKLEGGDKNLLTLWTVANPTLSDVAPTSRYDIFATYLFISHIKWLVIRLEAEGEKPAAAAEQKK
ncbi:hypothetical protein FDI85_gp018 [Erwinia phage Machina]|uniref:Uncharacterized protein n=2 Tax=Machinavirus machina TaxID=2169990 RepID=A0A1B2IDI4_9CAUD|nr:hypothetical protein BIZ81_gp018 [Erwinia phage vB_EamM_Huxley]YP_009617183.1 hypothetical protein FDI85_gp018 [Erwinia phage Machina]ANZ49347.1 hypothetical protein HUXLEY_265 [Erwinia phage vB_EamM_Huxley]ANZ49904.1 hypothetical protein MACHINA_266 [Erwinia phage Machina]ANZ50175.1 hypothetical protein PARSHIK_266 [Erwinia phage vB_EamM_Parshik]